MVLRDIYNVLGDCAQACFLAEDYTRFEVLNVNTEAHYRYSRSGNAILLGGDTDEPLTLDWVLGLPVVGIDAVESKVRIWVDG